MWLRFKNTNSFQFLEQSFAFLLLGLLSPVMWIVAILIKLTDSGPVFYFQDRVGRDGKVFKIVKFRTMRMDAEKNGPQWAKGNNDPRITRLGSFLRKSHLDEFPQLLNVIQGQMSFVGPRPERPHFVDNLSIIYPAYPARHIIKPGITGLAQTRFRAEQSTQDTRIKLKYDLFYIKKASFRFDIQILCYTFLKMIFAFTRKESVSNCIQVGRIND